MRTLIGNLKDYASSLLNLKTEKKDLFIDFINSNVNYHEGSLLIQDFFQSIDYFNYDQVETRAMNGVTVLIFDYTLKVNPGVAGQTVKINSYLPSTTVTDNNGVVQGQFGIMSNDPVNVTVEEFQYNNHVYSGLSDNIEINLP